MKSAGAVVGPSPDEQAQQDLEDMRAELLHEIQDGDEAEDERVEVVSLQVHAHSPLALQPAACAANATGYEALNSSTNEVGD